MEQTITFFQDPDNVASAGAIYGFIGSFVNERNNVLDRPLNSMFNMGFSALCYGVGTYVVSHLFHEKVRFIVPVVLGLSAGKYVYKTYKDPLSVETFFPVCFKLIKNQ